MASEAGPSNVHEPDSASGPRSPDRTHDDVDTCRICRGEGTVEEPLFYPCKCSGSIKFVHQECLMEWLSHSQKKYCELCKTSFRFTKLYHPSMPTRIPTSVFIRRAAVHVLKLLVTWLRGVLVASVWLVILPFCMRFVWRSLFWVGDGGWVRDFSTEAVQGHRRALSSKPWDKRDLETVRSAIESARATNVSSYHLQLPSVLMPLSLTLNITSSEPTLWTLVKHFFFYYPLSSPTPSAVVNTTNSNASTISLGARSPSLLSDVPFFNWFPSQTANRFFIDVLEGQMITLLVVVAFILIFLIREWVVQQQPVINMVALGEDAAAERAPGHLEEEEVDEPELELEEVDFEEAGRQGVHVAEDVDDEDAHSDEMVRRPTPPVPTPGSSSEGVPDDQVDSDEDHYSTSNKRRRIDQPELQGSASASYPKRSSSLPQTSDSTHGANDLEPPSPPQRPNMPARDRSFIATEIRRSLEEGNSWSFANVPPPTGNEARNSQRDDVPSSWEDADEEGEVHPSGKAHALDGSGSDQDPESELSSGSWQQVPNIVVDDSESSQGKEKARIVDESASQSRDEQLSWDHASVHDEFVSAPREESIGVLRSDTAEGNSSSPVSAGSDVPQRDLEHDAAAEQEALPEQDPENEPPREPIRPERVWIDRFLDWLFGDIGPVPEPAEDDGNDEHIVEDLANEAPFVPFAANEPQGAANPPIQDPEVAAAAAQAGIDVNDQDAIDDAEDLEGILELIGMQGPLMGLVQNAMFSAVLISATLGCAIWLPYLCGKFVLLFMGSPISLLVKLPLRIVAFLTDLVFDTALFLTAGVTFGGAHLLRVGTDLVTAGRTPRSLENALKAVAGPALSTAEKAVDHLQHLVYESSLPHPDCFRLSVNSHVALRTIQNSTSYALNRTGDVIASFYDATADPPSELAYRTLQRVPNMLHSLVESVVGNTTTFFSRLLDSQSYKITLNLDVGGDAMSAHAVLDQWTATDRLIAVLAGYAFFAVIGAMYLKRGSPFSASPQGRKIEAIVTEVLQQAGGVVKVILIISIEMLAFPLYCGLLLDLALLPLFENASLYSRWQFGRESPWTSGFVHWFIGTCYMFHFALFVSMCRKIMRPGVLYFIRDPDDPTFHPVRDVLERSVTTQLRKIAFSALVYGALVIVCLGGVVWGLNRATTGVLPIRWASQAPSLEFPLDLLFYNFLTPLIIKVYKPSDGLQVLYQWWFKACARLLRLSHFLFGDKVKEEEGHHVRPSWSSWLVREKGDAEKPVTEQDHKMYVENGRLEVYFQFDGRYVRAPASDQVRIPKGERVFVEVDHDNRRKDGKSDHSGGVHNSDKVTMVYVPPWFRVRIALFVFTIWGFAAFTGISATVIPLLFGRLLFSLFLPPTVEMNDIHAFSLGIYTLGTCIYSSYQLYKLMSSLSRAVPSPIATILSTATAAAKLALRTLRFSYVWTSFILVFPLLFATVIELYLLMPLHAYIGPREPHVVHFIQDWTLGFLYARITARLIFSNGSRASRAFRAIVADGYMDPNARLATRCFILPVSVLFALAVVVPSCLAFTLNHTLFANASQLVKNQVWRFSFPVLGLWVFGAWVGREIVHLLNRWRLVVRDEVYLIGERLHNFGEKRPPAPTPPPVVPVAGEDGVAVDAQESM